MYATIKDIAQIPEGAYRLEQVGTGDKRVLAFWETEQDAKEAGDQVYEVDTSWTGPAGNETAQACTLIFLDGPLSQARWDAGQFAHENRIKPLLMRQDGYVRGYTLLDRTSRSVVVVNMADTFENLEVIGKAVTTMELLPEEDPALLTGPDRFEIHRVG